MTRCRELADGLGDYVAGDLTDERRGLLDDHLRQCPPCVRLLESYRLTIALVRRLPPAPLPDGLLVRLRGALGEDPRSSA